MVDRCKTCGRAWAIQEGAVWRVTDRNGFMTPRAGRPCDEDDCPNKATPPTRYLTAEESAAMDRALRKSTTLIYEGSAPAAPADDLPKESG